MLMNHAEITLTLKELCFFVSPLYVNTATNKSEYPIRLATTSLMLLIKKGRYRGLF